MTDKIITKIQKLAAMAESANQLGNLAEAAAFSAKVNDLLVQHNLSMGDLDTAADDNQVDGQLRRDLGLSRMEGKWTVHLLTVLCEYNFCQAIYHGTGSIQTRSGRLKPSKSYESTIIGRPENIEVVTYLYTILKRQFETLALTGWKHMLKDCRQQILAAGHKTSSQLYKRPWTQSKAVPTKRKWLTSFYLGAVIGVQSRLKEQKESAQTEYGQKLTGLILARNAEIDQYMDQHWPNINTMKGRKNTVHGSAYQLGHQAGRSANMARGLATGDTIPTKQLKQ